MEHVGVMSGLLLLLALPVAESGAAPACPLQEQGVFGRRVPSPPR